MCLAISNTMWILCTLLLLAVEGQAATGSRFTNVQCDILDIGYLTYPQCSLKMLARGVVGLNIHMKLLQKPVTSVKINLSLWRKYSGFRPFMFNTTFDYCKFTAKKNPQLSFELIFLKAVADKSNINHTCPYDHDIIIRDMVFKEEYLKLLPLPSGEYKFQILIATSNTWRTNIFVNVLHNENLLK